MDVASLSLEVKTDSLKQATAELRELPKAASAAERAAEKWSNTTKEAGRTADDFSKRVKSTIASLEFERQQLARSATERARFTALRRAGVAEMSAEGQAITASIRALDAQRSAMAASAAVAQKQAAGFAELARQQAEETRRLQERSANARAMVADLEFERQQLVRTGAERAKFAALRQAGVSEGSAEGAALSASVASLHAEKAALDRAAAATGTNEAAARKLEEANRRLKESVAAVINDLRFEAAQLGRSTVEREKYAALRRAGVAESSAEGRAIAASVVALHAQRDALGHVSLGTRAMGAAASAATNTLRTMLATLGPIALAFLAVQKVMAAFEFASGLDEAAEQIGVTAENLQALQFAAVQSGVKMEQLDTGLSQFSRRMGEAAEGSKEMVEALTKLGVKNLDVAGKLRPTEDILVDVARAITSIDDPARRSAAAVDFFGKAGTRMLPMLAELSGGLDAMGQRADEAGAIIDTKTIKILDAAADAMARWSQVITAQLAKALAHLLTIVEGVAMGMTRLAEAAGAGMTKLVDSIEVGGAQAVAMFTEAFSAMPDVLGQVFTNAWEAARVATSKGINAITSLLPEWMGLGGTNLDTQPRGTGPVGAGLGDRVAAAGEAAAQAMRDRQLIARQAAMQSDEDRARIGKLGAVGGPGTAGAATSAIKGSGGAAENAAKKYEQLIAQLDLAVSAQDKMTAAAGRGEVAYDAMKVKLEAQEKALSIFGKALDENDPRLKKLEERMLSIAQGKVAESFANATTELQNQNVILEAQIRLMNEAPEIQARELALIKAKTEAEKAGTAVTQEAIDARRQAIEQNETLKAQQEELKRSQELWTAPLKSALESIQQTAADAFEGILETGKFSFDSLRDVFVKTLRRMAAEFLALATIRPVMSVMMNAISPSMAQGMGSSGGGSMGGGGMLGSLSGLGGGISDFLGQTLIGGTEIMGPLQPGAAALGSTGGLTVGGALGGAASLGMGAFQMFSGGGSAGSMLGGGLGMAGGLVSMLGPMMGLGAAAGPIGMGIGLLAALLPSLLGGQTKPTITNQTSGDIAFRNGGFQAMGGAWGPNADATASMGQLSQIGSSMSDIFRAFGGVKEAGKVWSLALESFSETYGDDSTFSNQTSFLIAPGGRRTQWGQGSTPGDVAFETAAGVATINSILEGAVGDITENMRRALNTISNGKQTVEIIASTVTEIMAFDAAIENLGKTVSPIGDAFAQIDQQFSALYTTASKFGLGTGAIDQAVAKARQQVATDFDVGLRLATLDMTDPLQAALERLEQEKKDLVAQNDDIVKQFGSTASRIADIEAFYAAKRAGIVEQSNAAALAAQQQAAQAAEQAMKNMVQVAASSVSSIQGLIRELSPGGALANLDPAGQLAGLRASAGASLAQAFASPTDTALIDRAVSDQRAFLEASRSFTGGSTAYVRDQQVALGQLQSLQGAATQGAMGGASDPAVRNLLQQLLAATQASNTNSAKRSSDIDKVIGLLARYLANEAA